MTARIKKEITKRLVESGFKPITITMKVSGDELTITPYGNNITGTQDIVACDISGQHITSQFCEQKDNDVLDFIADTIINYETLKREMADDDTKLEKFYNDRIKGHTRSEQKDGMRYFKAIYEDWKDLSDFAAFEENYDVMKLDETKDETYIRECLALVENISTYSDWYKSVYDRRPTLFDEDGVFC